MERRLEVRSWRLARREAWAIQSLVSSPDWGANKSVSPTPTPKPISKPNTVLPFDMRFPFPQIAQLDTVLDSLTDSAAVFGGLTGCRFVAEGLRMGRKWPKSIPIRCASIFAIHRIENYVARISWLGWPATRCKTFCSAEA